MEIAKKKVYEVKCYKGSNPRVDVTEEFITKNNMTLGRSDDEILAKIKEDTGFGFSSEILSNYLSWEKSKQLYNKEYVEKVENGCETEPKKILDLYETVQDMLDYMVFGWDKAMDERGLSAGRTVGKIGTWLWLLGREDLNKKIHEEDLYNPYGAPALIAVCEELGIEVPDNLREFASHPC